MKGAFLKILALCAVAVFMGCSNGSTGSGPSGQAAVTGVSLNNTAFSMPPEETFQLTATVSPAYAANKAVTWSSSDEAKVTVDQNGKVSGVNVTGMEPVTITVATTDGGFTAMCMVTVKAVSSINLTAEPGKKNYVAGQNFDLTGLEVTATFTDGTTAPVPIDLNHVAPQTFTAANDDQTVTITYGGSTKSITGIKVRNPLVTFNSNGGTALESKTVTYGEAAEAPAVPKKSEAYLCKFGGWYSNSGFSGSPWNFSIDKVTADMTLYAKWEAYTKGEAGPGGGTIFYRSETYFILYQTAADAIGIHAYYLEAAPENSPNGDVNWASSSFLGDGKWVSISNTGTAIGTGRKNTKLIRATDNNAPAAKDCEDLTTGNMNDWFLPSKDELNELFKNKSSIPSNQGLKERYYWSSSESDIKWAYAQHLSDGTPQREGIKNGYYYVRAIRAF